MWYKHIRIDAPHVYHQSSLSLPHWTSFMESTPNQVGEVPAISELYYGFNPIALHDSWTTLLQRPLFNELAIFFSNFTKFRSTTLPNRRWTDLSLIWMCLLIFILALSCFRISMVDLESVWTELRSISLCIIENSDKRFFNHSSSVQVVSRAISSDSIVLLAITVYL